MRKRRYSDFRQRLRFQVQENWFDLCEKRGWPDWVWDITDGPVDFIIRIVCKIKGHEPIPDNCGIPAHDYCAWCMKSTPGQA